jgi:S1-C subfamily serine protease
MFFVSSSSAAAQDAPHIGLKIPSLSPELRKERQLGEEIKGVLVTGVTAGSPAQGKGIVVGEVIAEAGGEQVRAPKDVAAQVAAKRASSDRAITLGVLNAKGQRREVTIELAKAAIATKPILPGPK